MRDDQDRKPDDGTRVQANQAAKAEQADRLIHIDGVAYKAGDLSPEALKLVSNIQMVDAKLNAMSQEAAMFNTARLAYIQALQKALPDKSEANMGQRGDQSSGQKSDQKVGQKADHSSARGAETSTIAHIDFLRTD